MSNRTRSSLVVVPATVLSARLLESGEAIPGLVAMALGTLALWLAVTS